MHKDVVVVCKVRNIACDVLHSTQHSKQEMKTHLYEGIESL